MAIHREPRRVQNIFYPLESAGLFLALEGPQRFAEGRPVAETEGFEINV
jgi:hypothetical protein